MLAVDRGNYTSVNPYSDAPQPIGYAATISGKVFRLRLRL